MRIELSMEQAAKVNAGVTQRELWDAEDALADVTIREIWDEHGWIHVRMNGGGSFDYQVMPGDNIDDIMDTIIETYRKEENRRRADYETILHQYKKERGLI